MYASMTASMNTPMNVSAGRRTHKNRPWGTSYIDFIRKNKNTSVEKETRLCGTLDNSADFDDDEVNHEASSRGNSLNRRQLKEISGFEYN